MGSNTPNSIDCSAQPFDISFHPHREYLMAAALVDGTLEVHDFLPPTDTSSNGSDEEHDTIVSSIPLHTQLLSSSIPGNDKNKKGTRQASCRAVRFSSDGSKIFTGGSAGDVCVVDAEVACTLSSTCTTPNGATILWNVPDAHGPSGIHVLHQLPPDAPTGPLLVTGDENGGVRLWDDRRNKKQPVLTWNENTDYISGFDHGDNGATLLASSADCTLSVFDLRKANGPPLKPGDSAVRRSDDQEDELLSVKVIKHGRKVVCGTQEGVLAVWSYGTWGDISDRFPGHPASIDALLKVDEDTLLTGSSDGVLRLVQIHPDRLLGVLGEHDGYPIEKLQFNADKSYVGSVSHDNSIRLWDARELQDDTEDDGEEETEEVEKVASVPVAAAKPAATSNDSADEWEDDDNDSDEDSSVDESEEDTRNQQRTKRLKTDNEKFFEDL